MTAHCHSPWAPAAALVVASTHTAARLQTGSTQTPFTRGDASSLLEPGRLGQAQRSKESSAVYGRLYFFLNKYSKSCIYYSFIIHSTTSVEIGGKNKGVEEKRATDTSRPSPSVQTLRKSKPWPWPQEPVAQQEGKQRHAQCSMLPGGLAESRRTSKEGTTRLPWGAHRTRPFSLCMVGRGGGRVGGSGGGPLSHCKGSVPLAMQGNPSLGWS